MPAQTQGRGYITFPDGCKIQIKAPGGSWTDLGAMKGTTKLSLEWKENQQLTANAGETALQAKDMKISGGFTLIDLDPAGVALMGGGLLTSAVTAGSAVSTIPNQIIPAAWDDNRKYELIVKTSANDSTKLKLNSKPAITSVTLDAGGTPETLAEIGAAAGGDYMIIADPSSYSGWSIIFNSAGMTKVTPKNYAITIAYDTNTPVARTTVYAGSSMVILTAYGLRAEHTDSQNRVRGVELYSVNPKSGGFNFDFKGADEEGLNEMPLTFTGIIDTSLTDGRQLMSWYVDNGAQ